MKRGDVIEYEGIVEQTNDDGTLDLDVPEYTGESGRILIGIRGVHHYGVVSIPQPGDRVIVERRYPARDPRVSLRWQGVETDLPPWADSDRTGLRSPSGRVLVVLEDDEGGDDSGTPRLYLGKLGAEEDAVLGNVFHSKLDTLTDEIEKQVAEAKKHVSELSTLSTALGTYMALASAAWKALAGFALLVPVAGPVGAADAGALVLQTAANTAVSQLAAITTAMTNIETAIQQVQTEYPEFLSNLVAIAKDAPDSEEEASREPETL